MNRTGIEYLDLTWNPVAMRCERVSDGCAHCWHLRMAKRMAGNKGIPREKRDAYRGGLPVADGRELLAPMRRKKPAVIGVQFMGDLFGLGELTIGTILNVIGRCPQHRFLLLTKRPEKMREFASGYGDLENVWWGVSGETMGRVRERWAVLEDLPVRKVWLSLEPVLEEMRLERLRWVRRPDWVAMGPETGPGARRDGDPEWYWGIKNWCVYYGVPLFDKRPEPGCGRRLPWSG